MYAGRIVEEGPAGAVFDDSVHPYTRALAGAFPPIGDPVSATRRRACRATRRTRRTCPPGCPFHPRCPVAIDERERVDPPLLHIGDRDAACLRVTRESVAAGDERDRKDWRRGSAA